MVAGFPRVMTTGLVLGFRTYGQDIASSNTSRTVNRSLNQFKDSERSKPSFESFG